MSEKYHLLLSPHPDDLVFSAFSELIAEPNIPKIALVFFNVSRFNRWSVNSVKLVTAYRMFEDKIILGSVKLRVKYLFFRDTSVSEHDLRGEISTGIKLEEPSKILCPLGVGSQPNHISVRNWAIEKWLGWQKVPELVFYEDLPYAAKMENRVKVETKIIEDLAKYCGEIDMEIRPLTSTELSKKLRLCSAYLSQTNYSKLLREYSQKRGKSTKTGYAEIFYRVE